MIKAIVTDIEGTTSSIDFVHQTLFPYARQHLADFVRTQQANAEVQEQLAAVERELGEAHLSLDEALAHLMEWMDEDRKLTPLKALQGMVWEAGYRQGDFTGHVYADAAAYLRRWHEQGLRLYVYSSGSVQAQKLLFAHSDAARVLFADLLPARANDELRFVQQAMTPGPGLPVKALAYCFCGF